jgi:integrase
MLVIDLLARYLSSHPYGLAESTEIQLRCTWRAYLRESRSSGLEAFGHDRVNDWLDRLREGHAPDTVRTQRGNILTLWWWAYREGLVEGPPLRVRKLRPIRRSPVAWSLEEVRELIHAAERRPIRSLWWSSIIRAGYDTGLRLGDLLSLRCGEVSAVIQIRQSKTGRPVSVRLRQETLAAALRLASNKQPDMLLWPLWGRREVFYREFRKIVRASGIRPGTFRWIRRAAATQLERLGPGLGTVLLGHQSRSTTESWYIDKAQLSDPPIPPM